MKGALRLNKAFFIDPLISVVLSLTMREDEKIQDSDQIPDGYNGKRTPRHPRHDVTVAIKSFNQKQNMLLYTNLATLFLCLSIEQTLSFTLPLKKSTTTSNKWKNTTAETGSSPNELLEELEEPRRPSRNTKLEGSYYQQQSERIKSKLNRGLKSFEDKKKKNENYTHILDYTLSLAVASDDEDAIKKIQREMNKCLYKIQPSTYRSTLRECSNAGNGRASLKVIKDMRSDNVQISESDIQLAVAAICKSNRFDYGIWRLGLDLLRNYAKDKRDPNDLLKLTTYNSLISCMTTEGCWTDVWELLSTMENQIEDRLIHPRPNLSTYHTILEGLFHSKDGPQLALKLLATMNSKGVSPSIYTFDLALSILLKRENNCWKMALDMIELMHQNMYTPTLVMYNRVMASCAQAQQLEHASSLLLKIKSRDMHPDIVTYNSIISACASSGRWRDALRYLQETIQDPNIEPDIITYTEVIRACAKGRKPDKALELFQEVKKKGLPLDTYVYASVIDACAKGSLWRKSLELLDEMRSSGIPPNRFAYSAAISACGNCGEWETAINLLDQMREEGMNPNLISYNAAISALSKSSRSNMHKATKYNYMKSGTNAITFGTDEQQLWKRALLLFETLKSEGIVPDAWTYSGVIATLGSCGKLQEALILVEEMRLFNKANKFSYTAAIDACRGQWESAHRLFLQMQEDDIEYDVVTYNALLSAYGAGDQADMAYKAWKQMIEPNSDGRKKVKLDIISLTIVVASLERCSTRDFSHEIDHVFADAVEHQIILPKDSMDTMWEIDLSGMSFPVARAACRFILKHIKAKVKQGDTCDNLVFITGIGKKRQSVDSSVESDKAVLDKSTTTPLLLPSRDGSLREYVRQILREDFHPPLYSTVPTRGEGMVQVTVDVLRAWIESK